MFVNERNDIISPFIHILLSIFENAIVNINESEQKIILTIVGLNTNLQVIHAFAIQSLYIPACLLINNDVCIKHSSVFVIKGFLLFLSVSFRNATTAVNRYLERNALLCIQVLENEWDNFSRIYKLLIQSYLRTQLNRLLSIMFLMLGDIITYRFLSAVDRL